MQIRWRRSLFILTAFLASILAARFASAADSACSRWRWTSPQPVPGTFRGVAANGDGFLAWGSAFASSRHGTAEWTIDLSGVEVNDVVRADDVWVAVGSRGAVWTSVDGHVWKAQPSVGGENFVRVATRGDTTVALSTSGAIAVRPSGGEFSARPVCNRCWWFDVVWAPEPIGRFVAVGGSVVEGGIAGVMATSLDGVNWENPPLPSNCGLRTVAVGGGRIVIGGEEGLIASSTDALNWSAAETGTSSVAFGSLAYANGLWLASGLGNRSPGTLRASRDGVTWRPIDASVGRIFGGHSAWIGLVREMPDPNSRLRVGIRTSVDGESWDWTPVATAALNGFAEGSGGAVVVGGGGQVIGGPIAAAGGPPILTSDDGVSFHAPESTLRGATIQSIVTGGDGLLAVGSRDGSGIDSGHQVTALFGSRDGQEWRQVGNSEPGLYASATFHDGRFFLVGFEERRKGPGPYGWSPLVVLGTPAGGFTKSDLSGVDTASISRAALTSVASGPGGLAAVGYSGLVLASSDGGATWSRATNLASTGSPADLLLSVAASALRWVAVGASGGISSDDGRTWRAIPSLVGSFREVVVSGSVWLARGNDGVTLFRSGEGLDWSRVSPDLPVETVRIVAGPTGPSGPTFVALGKKGDVIRSTDGRGEKWIPLADPSAQGFRALALAGSRILAAGEGGWIASLECVEDDPAPGLTSVVRR